MAKYVLIDGDSFVYRAGFSVEKTKYLVEHQGLRLTHCDTKAQADAAVESGGGWIWSRREVGSLDQAIGTLNALLQKAIKGAGGSGDTSPFIYLSPTGGTFRDSIATIRKYKGNRDTHKRPVYYPDLREYCVNTLGAMVAVSEEADDRISWTAREMHNQGKEVVIIGNDKDLVQIPGTHYNLEWEDTITVTEDEARIWFWCQVLSGDSADNVPGCWKFGYSKAKYFVTTCKGLNDEEVWPRIVKKYKESQKLEGCPYKDRDPEEVALETARLTRLKHKQNEPLWSPTINRESKDGQKEARKPRPVPRERSLGTKESVYAPTVSESQAEDSQTSAPLATD